MQYVRFLLHWRERIRWLSEVAALGLQLSWQPASVHGDKQGSGTSVLASYLVLRVALGEAQD